MCNFVVFFSFCEKSHIIVMRSFSMRKLLAGCPQSSSLFFLWLSNSIMKSIYWSTIKTIFLQFLKRAFIWPLIKIFFLHSFNEWMQFFFLINESLEWFIKEIFLYLLIWDFNGFFPRIYANLRIFKCHLSIRHQK